MRPDHLAKRQLRVGLIAKRGIQTIGTADHKRQILPPLITISRQQICKIRRGHDFAALIQHTNKRTFRQGALQQSGLGRLAAAFLILNLDQICRAKAQRTTGLVKPV